MVQHHASAELPEDVSEEEKSELERGCRLLRAMIAVVNEARPAAQDLPQNEGASHA